MSEYTKNTEKKDGKMKAYFRDIKENFKLKNYANYIGVTLVLILMASLQMSGALKRSTADLLTQIAYSILLAVSLNFVVGFLGELSLGHAGFMCVGAYLGTYVYLLMAESVSSKLLCLIVSMIVGGLSAAVFGFLVGLPALRLKGDYLAIVTLAFGEIVRNLCMNIPIFGRALGLKNSKTYGPNLFIVAFIVLLIALVIFQNLIKSKHGRAITAIRDNEIAARAMGINVNFYKLFAFVISAFFAGVAGSIYGAGITPVKYGFFSYNYSIEILVMVVLGGMGSVNGSILAATAITVINFFLQDQLTGSLAAFKLLIYALILIVVVIFNNAPGLKKYKEKFSIPALFAKLLPKKKADPEKEQAKIRDDSAQWNVIPTKINMDEVLSADLRTTTADNSDERQGDQ